MRFGMGEIPLDEYPKTAGGAILLATDPGCISSVNISISKVNNCVSFFAQ